MITKTEKRKHEKLETLERTTLYSTWNSFIRPVSYYQKEEDNLNKSNIVTAKGGKGITLIALVVTIVVLLILAGISITLVFGEYGIIQMAQRAADQTNKAVEQEQNAINEIGEFVNNYFNNENNEEEPKPKIRVGDLVGKPAVDKNQDVVDDYDNKVTVPAGFIVVADGEDNVSYNYSGDKRPNVQDGIVVEDGDGNQFVWIPVGEIINKDGSTNTIDLARYTFDIGEYDNTTKDYNGTGEIQDKILDGSSLRDDFAKKTNEKYDDYNYHYTYIEYLEELDDGSSSYGNAKAKDIEGFKSNSKVKGGYYLARFEASKGEDGKVKSKAAPVWNKIYQPDISAVSRNMYSNSEFESDLINSYAWDTALVFIQTYSENKAYSLKNNNYDSLINTGEGDDLICNIYDLACNYAEFTTETSTAVCYGYIKLPFTIRGNNNGITELYSSDRFDARVPGLREITWNDYYGYWNPDNSDYHYSNVTFRPIIYLNN